MVSSFPTFQTVRAYAFHLSYGNGGHMICIVKLFISPAHHCIELRGPYICTQTLPGTREREW